jgi:small subunit ribosomal protein S16
MGRKKAPHYRVVVADGDSPRDGRFVETIGYYKPLSTPARVVVDLERADYWLGQGAQPSTTVRSLLNKARKGGDASVAVGEVDAAAEKARRSEQLTQRRQAEADAEEKLEAEARAQAAARAAARAEARTEAEAGDESSESG